MLLILVLLHISLSCPIYLCKALNSTLCSTLHGFQIYLNTLPCPRDYFCKFSEFSTWSSLEPSSSANSFKCTRQNYNGFSYSDLKSQPDYFCGFRDTSQGLAEGSHPKVCMSDVDCVTIAGYSTECLCGFDGKKYCVAEIGSNAFDEYWKKCYAAQGSINNPHISAVEKAYWDYYYWFYIEIISSPDCGKSLFWEFSLLKDLDSYRTLSLAWILQVAGFVFYLS